METLGYLYGSVIYEAQGKAIAPLPSPQERSPVPGSGPELGATCPSGARSPAALLQFWLILASAAVLLLGTAPAAVADHLLRFGSQGSGVQQIQQELAIAGFYSGPVTGYYGNQTQAAVRRFQQAQGLAVDGVVGPNTRAALQRQLSRPLATPQFTPTQIYYTTSYPSGSRPALTPAIAQPVRAANSLYVGDSGPAVSQLQQSLQAIGYYSGPVTGYFGPQTQAAVIEFQRQNGLLVDGVVGPRTQVAIAQFPGFQPRFQPGFQPVDQPVSPRQTVATNQFSPASSIQVPAEVVTPPVPSRLEDVLYRGDSGPAVTQLQTDLSRFGYYQGPITGFYGPLTEDAVSDFQEDNDLFVTGIAGPRTVTALRNRGADLT